jgi:glycosyltransferase involved in cell wall biosynthesis
MNALTAILITFNEEENLPRALASLEGIADEVVLVDSGSSDRTRKIAAEAGARVFNRAWTDYSDQKNFAAANAVNDWVLSIDADEELSAELRASLREWKVNEPRAAAYSMARRANYLGQWIRFSGWYPDRKIRLYLRDLAHFSGTVHESLQVTGPISELAGDLLHYAYRTADEHERKVQHYTDLAAWQLYRTGRRSWRRAMIFVPPWTLLQTYVLRQGFRDGAHGWTIARMSARYAFLKYRKLGLLARGRTLDQGPSAHEEQP